MASTVTSRPNRWLKVAGVVLLVGVVAACGDDDDATPEVPEGGTGSIYNDTIIASESHDELLLDGGDGEMLVAVDCDPDGGGNLVTVIADGLDEGIYIGTFDPGTGVDLSLQVAGPGEAVAQAQMTLDQDEYTVTFDTIDGGVFDLRGCTV